MRLHLSVESNPSFNCFKRSCHRWRSVSGREEQRPRLFTLFSRIVGIMLLLIANLISWHFPLIMNRLQLLEDSIFITAHLKSSCRHFSSFSMCDFDSEITVKSSIKAFIDGSVFLLVVSLVLRSNISIAKTKINGEITQPIILFNFCQFVEYLALEYIYIYIFFFLFQKSN